MLCVFQGYLVIDNFFKEEELNTCKDAINLLVDQLANKLYSAGKIKSVCRWFHDNSILTRDIDIVILSVCPSVAFRYETADKLL